MSFLAVLKMEAVTIAGKIEDIESVVSKYVIGQEIHLEDALSVLENGEKLTPFVEDNQNEVIEKLAKEIRDRIPMPLLETHQETQFSDAEMQSFLENFSEQMETIRKKKIFSKPVVKSIDYIYSHLHCRITVAEVAAYVGLNENYFSRLFSCEVGISVSRYILQRKLEVAQNMLKYSDYSCSQISELLCFASQSHFIEKFRKEYGMTPLHYRNRYHSDMGLKEET